MKRSSIAALCLFGFVLGGCATGYHSQSNPIAGFTGGYWDQKGPGRLIKVGFDGNSYIERDKVGTYLLYRCAEVAQREGSNYFVMYSSLPAAIMDKRSSGRTVATTGGKPSTYAYILLMDQEGPGVLSVKDTIERLKPEVAPEVKS